jgi:perosamine synthetase
MTRKSAGAFLPVAAPSLGPLERRYLHAAYASGWISSMGEYLARFEEGFAKFCGVRHAIALSNGTVALHLAYVAAGIGPGDEVIVPTLTFAATASMVKLCGARPVFVDSRLSDWCLDPAAVERAIGPKTKAVVAVHIYGQPAAMTELADICRRRNVLLLEDAAEAHGAKVGRKVVGSLGKIGTFSFYGNKILTTGEGGAVTTDDDALAERMRMLKDHAMDPDRRYWHLEAGYNYRMTNLQAAIGVAQLERIEDLIARRRRLYDWYREDLDGVVALNPRVRGTNPVYWMASALLPEGVESAAVRASMKSEGVDSRPFFEPLHEMPPYRRDRRVGADGGRSLPAAAELSRRGINLPSGPDLRRADVRRAAAALKRGIAAAESAGPRRERSR